MQREQFIELVKAEQEGLRRFLLALTCGNRDDADDLAQEALVKAYLASGTFRSADRFRAWLYKIAYNTFISSHRSPKDSFVSINAVVTTVPHRQASSQDCLYRQAGLLDANSGLCDQPDLSLSPDRRYRYQELYMALAQLPPKERGAVVLYYLNERSVKEISKITDSGDTAVRSLLMRGRNRLRKILDDYGKR